MVQKIQPHKTQVGMTLSDEDVEAIKKLFSTVWCANVTLKNWKEKNTGNYCQWTISLPDKNNTTFNVMNTSLPDAVDVALKVHWVGVDSKEYRDYNAD